MINNLIIILFFILSISYFKIMVNNFLIIVIFLMIAVSYFKDNINMIYFVPMCGLLLIYLNTNKYEHFLCKFENKVSDIFSTNQFFQNLKNRLNDAKLKYGPDALIKKARNDTRNNLLKINKNAENLILKI